MVGVAKFLSNLETRAPRQPADPKVHRELFIEPWIDAQQVGVPVETAEAVAELLQRFGVLRLWVRVHCPDADESEPATILETDNADDFDQLVAKSCGHCGRHHDLTWEHCETIFAFNVAGSDAEQKFDYGRLRSTVLCSPSRETERGRDLVRCEVAANEILSTATEPRLVVSRALRSNSEVTSCPPPWEAWLNAWGGPVLILVAYMLLIIPITMFCGQFVTYVVSLVTLVIVFLVIRGQVLAKLAPTAIQRTAMYLGFPIATCCITAGATGLHFKASADQDKPWWARVDLGEESWPMIGAGVMIFVATLVFVWCYDFRRGWLK